MRALLPTVFLSTLDVLHPTRRCARVLTVLAAILLLFGGTAEKGAAQTPPTPGFSKAFNPGTIGPGSISMLQFTIVNGAAVPVTGLSFTDNLPAGVVIATPASAGSNCEGALSAPDGGTTISFSDGRLGAGRTCIITVNVTSSTAGTHTNTTGDLTSSAGTSDPATADLTVDAGRPGFSKSFSPAAIPFGGRSTLTLTIDNTANTSSSAFNLTFIDNLPPGMRVASPNNASTTCTGGVLSAVPGGGVVSYGPTFGGGGDASVGASSSCTVQVDVTGTAVGLHVNTTGELTSTPTTTGTERSSGKASAALTVTIDAVSLTKLFVNDPVPPGGTVVLRFTLRNTGRSGTLTDIAFTDDLDAVLEGLVATGLPTNPCGGTLTGTSLLDFSGGTLAAGTSCTFDVTLQLPAGTSGTFPNTTSAVSADAGGEPVAGAPASDLLFVEAAPILTKTYVPDVAGPGDTVILRFTITNTSGSSGATNIAFTDEFNNLLPILGVTLPADGFCGTGSTMTTAIVSGVQSITMTGGNLAGAGSCTFDVSLALPLTALNGTFPNVTSAITATVDAKTVTGAPATDDLTVIAPPTLTKTFTDDPVVPGSTVTLAFTLTHSANAPAAAATAIAFTDDLGAVLSGLAATGTPVSACGGTLSGTSVLSFSGGSLSPGTSCTISVTLNVPAEAKTGDYTNTTSNVTATVGGATRTGAPATDDLTVTPLRLVKAFTDDPVGPGGTVTLEFTLSLAENPDGDATNIAFTDDLDDVLSGLVVSGSLPDPAPACGAGATLTGTSELTFSGGSLTAGSSCTFSVTLAVPANATPEVYQNTTSAVSATLDGETVSVNPASDLLTVVGTSLVFDKDFIDDPVAPGGTVTLAFTIDYSGPANATGITFTDDLNATLSGLMATGLPASDVCGTGSTLSGTSVLTFSGGSLEPGTSCTFSVTLAVPANATPEVYQNTTSAVSATLDGATVTVNPASDLLTVVGTSISLTKDFTTDPVPPGGLVALAFTIGYSGPSNATGITFTDNLNDVLSGLVATGLPKSVCGGTLSGTSMLTFAGGTLAPGGSCTFSAMLQVPANAADGTYPNTTSDITATVGGQPVTGIPASADLEIATGGNRPPEANAGEDQTVECASPDGAAVTLDGSGSSDPNGGTLSYRWTEIDEGVEIEIAIGENPTVTLALGVHTITLTVKDEEGETASDVVVITVEDTTPPVITLTPPNPLTLIRFSGPYVEPGVTVDEVCDPNPTLTIVGAVNTNLPNNVPGGGPFNITYDARDVSNNNAAQKVRIVNVIDDPAALAHDFLLLGGQTVVVAQVNSLIGNMHSNAQIDVNRGVAANKGGPTIYTSNLTAVSQISVSRDNTINGDLTAGGTISIANNATINGNVMPNTPVAPVPLPSLSFTAGGNNVTVPAGGMLTLAPGSYGVVLVQTGGTLKVSTGSYFFSALTMESGAHLDVSIPTGPVAINVVTQILLFEDVTMSLSPLGEVDGEYLKINTLTNMVVKDRAKVLGQLIAPNGFVNLEKDTRLRGAICAKFVNVDKGGANVGFPPPIPSPLQAANEASFEFGVAKPGRQGEKDAAAKETQDAPEDAAAADLAAATAETPSAFVLAPNYPNPFNPQTTIRFGLPEAAPVTLAVYDLLGRQVRVLVDGVRPAGMHAVVFEAGALPSGTYLYRLQTPQGGFVQTMLLLK